VRAAGPAGDAPRAPERLAGAPDPPPARDSGDAAVAAVAAVCVLSILAYGRPPLPAKKKKRPQKGVAREGGWGWRPKVPSASRH
jgi:hypothetical protein